jgi:alkylation response protein AidB-like acyl-CoA dehydrogenase
LTESPCIVVDDSGEIASAVADAMLVGAVLTAADSLGVASRSLELSREYALTREQFDRPIATFQVIKHKLVDMYIDLQTAISAVQQALADIDAASDGWRLSASMAKARASDAATHIVREAIQVHGGIGFTWEHELSHHFRRATAQRVMYGAPAAHRRLVADAKGF